MLVEHLGHLSKKECAIGRYLYGQSMFGHLKIKDEKITYLYEEFKFLFEETSRIFLKKTIHKLNDPHGEQANIVGSMSSGENW